MRTEKERREERRKGKEEREYKAIKVRIKTEKLTKRKKQRLEQITGRDTRIIKEYLKILKKYEKQLTVKRGKKRTVNKSKLDQWTLTTTKNTRAGKRE